MATRRQEKVSSVIKEAVSDAIANHLSDPRIEGVVTVTRVEMGTGLRNADVFISVLGKNEASQNKTFIAIKNSKSRIQTLLGRRVKSKFCPVLHFHKDEKFKKTLDILNLIDKAVEGLEEKDPDDCQQD